MATSPSLTGTTYASLPSTSSTTQAQGSPTAFSPPNYTLFPPFYTLQPNLTTRARQLTLWSSLITSYCAFHRIFRLSLSALPSDLFANSTIHRALSAPDIRTVLDHLALPANGGRIEWIPASSRGENSNSCWVYWRTLGEWADLIYGWVDETGQKGAVLTVYEIRDGEAAQGKEWVGMDEEMLRKTLAVLVKRGKAQIFGQEDTAGVKFF
jgi:ESCRT-II complex subunit VPS25